MTPTDLSAAYPYGGTALGVTELVSLDIDTPRFEIEDTYQGGLLEVFTSGTRCTFRAVLSEWDDAELDNWWPTGTGGSSGLSFIEQTASTTVRPGIALGTGNTAKILWIPNNTTGHPGILIFKGVLARGGLVSWKQSSQTFMGFEIEVLAMRDATDRLWAHGLLADLTL